MRHRTPLIAAAAAGLCIAPAYADLGDQLAKLLANDAAAGDWLGYSVAISGAAAIVGAHMDEDNGAASGSAYLFSTTTGLQVFKFLPNDGAVGDQFGISVAISGAIAIVGAYLDEDNGAASGSAYLFDTQINQIDAGGGQIAKLLPDDGAAGDRFGRSVAIDGAIAIVGAYLDDDRGSAYLFDISDPASPIQIAKLVSDDAAASDWFGYSLAISGSTAIVGAPQDDDNGSNSGSAYLFDISDPASVTQIAKLLPDDGAAGDLFGYSVAISGDSAMVGAWQDADNGFSSGSAYLFDATTGRQAAKLLPNDGALGDEFGWSVAISGATAIVAAVWDGDNGAGSGSAYLFDICDPASPLQIAKLLPDDGAAEDQFGWSVAISGATTIVGALFDDDHGGNSGSAYLFDAAIFCPWDLNGNLAVGPADLLFVLGAWGRNPDHPADFDGDGSVGTSDLIALLGNWGPCL